MITKFDTFINEGVKDKMTPKSKDDVVNAFKKLSPKQKINYIKKNYDEDFLDDIEEVTDLLKEIEAKELLKNSFIKLVHMIVNREDETITKNFIKKAGLEKNKELEEIKKRMKELDKLSKKIQKSNKIDISNPEYYNGSEFVEYSFYMKNSKGKNYIAGMSINFETDDDFCSIYYYLDDMAAYHAAEPDTIEELEKMIKKTVIK